MEVQRPPIILSHAEAAAVNFLLEGMTSISLIIVKVTGTTDASRDVLTSQSCDTERLAIGVTR